MDDEAGAVIGQIESGTTASDAAKASVAQIEDTISTVGELVEEVDKQNDEIARSTGTISQHVNAVQSVLTSFDEAARINEGELQGVHSKMGELEFTANAMFDSLVQAGLSPQDSAMVDIAQGFAHEAALMVEQALENGDLSEAQLFDQNYRRIDGSNPPRFLNELTGWADQNWQPMLNKAAASQSAIIAAACTDMKGFLPTHLSSMSQAPTGNLAHDTKYCRNGRIIFDGLDQKAKASSAPYMLAVYRQEGDGQNYRVVRNVYAPIHVNGRRWGDFELAYSFD